MSDEYEVEKIIDKRIKNGKVEYKIKWVGYSYSECTWEPLKNLENIQKLIDDFETEFTKKKFKKKNKYLGKKKKKKGLTEEKKKKKEKKDKEKKEKKDEEKKIYNLKIKPIYKNNNNNRNIKNKKETTLNSPKKMNLLNKSPFSEIGKKSKNYIKKNKGCSYISKRNSCDNFLLETKTKRGFKEKYGYTIKKTNAFTPNKSSLTQNKNDSTIISQRSILMSPKIDISNTKIYNNDSSCFSPILIRVNRKSFLENVKKKQNLKNEKSIQSPKFEQK